MKPREVVVRVALVCAAAVAVLFGAPTWITAPLWIATLLATADLLVPVGRRSDGTFRVMAIGAISVTILAFSGLFLGLSGIGFQPDAWGAVTAVVALGAIALRRKVPTARVRRVRSWANPVWSLIVVGLVAGAFVVSVVGTTEDGARLELFVGSTGARSTVTVRGGAERELTLRIVSPGSGVDEIAIETAPSRTSRIAVAPRVQANGARMTLRSPSGRVVRSLILQPASTNDVSGAARTGGGGD